MSLATRPPWQVRVHRGQGRVVGGGTLCANDMVLTCAHVVGPVGTEVHVDFPFLRGGGAVRARVVAAPDAVTVGGQDDVAVLRPERVPPGAMPAPFAETDEPDPRGECRAYGFPGGHPEGVWADGLLMGRTGSGLVQFESARLQGHATAPGFSGSPLWHEETRTVIGLVAAVEGDTGLRTAYAVPVDGLRKHWPQLSEPHPVRLWVHDPYGAPPRMVPLRGGGRERREYWIGRDGGTPELPDIVLASRPPHVVGRWHCRLAGEHAHWFVESPSTGPRTYVRRAGRTDEEAVPDRGKLRLHSGDTVLIPALVPGRSTVAHWELEFVDDRRTLPPD
ncbi:serine protease [Streptomyces sp. Ru72]|uniref:S1 family peptidase n=1 Tax=Streptomyces sp. Ru72 TaxID=2080747 RepID=UPI0015E3BAA5|nr:serine protease [Streptomyces sp. Ru72]